MSTNNRQPVTNRARVGGSGFTVFTWQSQLLAFANQVAHTSPTPVGPGPVPIHPMDEPYPVEVVTPAAAGMGTLTLEFFELYGQRVWERLVGLAGTVDIVHIFKTVAALDDPIRVIKYIRPPKLGGRTMAPYSEEYNNCVVTNVVDGETINIGTMEVLKQLTIGYTHITRGGTPGAVRNDTVPSIAGSSSPNFA